MEMSQSSSVLSPAVSKVLAAIQQTVPSHIPTMHRLTELRLTATANLSIAFEHLYCCFQSQHHCHQPSSSLAAPVSLQLESE